MANTCLPNGRGEGGKNTPGCYTSYYEQPHPAHPTHNYPDADASLRRRPACEADTISPRNTHSRTQDADASLMQGSYCETDCPHPIIRCAASIWIVCHDSNMEGGNIENHYAKHHDHYGDYGQFSRPTSTKAGAQRSCRPGTATRRDTPLRGGATEHVAQLTRTPEPPRTLYRSRATRPMHISRPFTLSKPAGHC